MKKTVAAALAAAFVMGTGATTFAAANPFSDVPAGHWAYNSVAKLAAEGVIEGYGDGTYRGDRNITRYEMAQMIAKAMAKNPSGATKADLDRLAAEFRDELDALGVRVAELEKYADKVVWQGKIEYTYKNH
ncbi:MAG: S-layer homology domain-containing protein, partial [Selenomonadaceae bacterium]|nr:S-layer homology domain-containing protein [Selenomonadaceae bacterium]